MNELEVMSSSSTAAWTLLAMLVLVAAIGFLLYRRARRDGRWDRMMGRTGGEPSGTRLPPELAAVHDEIEEAAATARGAVELLRINSISNGDLELLVGSVEDVSARLVSVLDVPTVRASDATAREVLTALRPSVADLHVLTQRIVQVAARSVSEVTSFELTQLEGQYWDAAQGLGHRQAARFELIHAVEDERRFPPT
jgi:hypothetical protein